MLIVYRRSQLMIAFVVWLASILAYGGLGFLADTSLLRAEEHEKKELLVKTPWGSFEATETPDSSRLGLPIYPGSKYLKGEDSGTAEINLNIKGKPNIHILAGKFQTSDTIEKVREFYKKKLGNDVTKFTEKTAEGNTVFEIKRKSLMKVVGLKSAAGGTQIELAHIEGLEEGND